MLQDTPRGDDFLHCPFEMPLPNLLVAIRDIFIGSHERSLQHCVLDVTAAALVLQRKRVKVDITCELDSSQR